MAHTESNARGERKQWQKGESDDIGEKSSIEGRKVWKKGENDSRGERVMTEGIA
jgi:hypothetical protein